MPTAAFATLGCKVNQAETQAILESFLREGFQVVPFPGPADVCVLNTCSVTSMAEAKSRALIRKARRENPEAQLIVTGCAAQMRLNRSEGPLEGEIVVPNSEKDRVVDALAAHRPDLIEAAGLSPAPSPPPRSRTRAAIKVQDGCDVFCSYCSIPFTRPGMRSRPHLEVLAEAQALARQGCREGVLTGVLIGSYGPETGSGGPDFEGLVRLLSDESGLERIRISSIELHQATDRLIDLAAEGRVAPHFHIPLQSGDSGVLADMNRRYDAPRFLARLEEIRRAVPGVCFTTDILAGFPTETDERFERSLQTVHEARFLAAHVFRFSPRWGTPADAWGDPVPPEAKQERARRLARAAEETGRAERARFLGTALRVSVERPKRSGLLEGLCGQGFTVRFSGPPTLAGTLQWVVAEQEAGGALAGEWAGSEPPQGLKMAAR
jgi:threonylcarbamoyladenosine tRNA methylthiotransferase MtaB